MKRIVVAITGSSGAVYGARLVQVLADQPDVETHLIVSHGARVTLGFETSWTAQTVAELADVVHDEKNLGASIASGTYPTDGMIVAPCSMKSLSAIANSYADSLVARAADVCLKERRRLVLVVRETPLHAGHLRLMTLATEAGAVILPPVPGFYSRPRSIEELVDHTIMKILDQFGVTVDLVPRWQGIS